MQFRKIWLAVVCAGGLSACGETVSDQAVIGTAVGAGTAAVVNGNLLAGAAIGAAGNILYCQQYPSRC